MSDYLQHAVAESIVFLFPVWLSEQLSFEVSDQMGYSCFFYVKSWVADWAIPNQQ